MAPAAQAAFAIKNTMGSGITLTKTGTKKIIEVVRSLENSEILSKGTTGKLQEGQEVGLFNSLAPLMKAGLPLMKNVEKQHQHQQLLQLF